VTQKSEKYRVTERNGDYERRVYETGDTRWWRTRASTGPYRPSWKIDQHGVSGGPFTVSFTFTELVPGWDCRFDHVLRDGEITLDRVEIFGGDGDPSLLYRKLGGRALEQQIADEFCQDFFRRILAKISVEWAEASLRKRRTGRRPAGDIELAQIADAYLRACEDEPRAPMPELVKREGIGLHALQGMKREAVQRGLLKLNGQGKAGGHLTAKAKRLLKEGK
jgi:hypothetical protein